MLPDLEKAMQVQRLDLQLADYKAQLERLPAEVQTARQFLDVQVRRADGLRKQLAERSQERKKLEQQLPLLQSKREKLRGQVKTAQNETQYKAFEHEIAFCEQQITNNEDRAFALLEEEENLNAQAAAAGDAVQAARESLQATERDAAVRTEATNQRIAELRANRTEVAATVAKPVLDQYERLRAKRKNGIAIVEAIDGRCTFCQMAIRSQLFQELKADERLIACESCGSLLAHNPAKSFEPYLIRKV